GVVGHQPLGDDPVLGVEGEDALEEGGHGCCFLVGVDLGVGEPGVVVDECVHEVVAYPRLSPHPLTGALRAVTGDAVARSQETGIAAGVHVQQIAWARPLIAIGRLPLRSRRPREPEATQHLPDRRVREAGRAGDQARPPARLAAAVADRAFASARQPPWTACGPARAIKQTDKSNSLPRARSPPAPPPTMRGRRPDSE